MPRRSILSAAERNTGDDAQGHPQRQVTLEAAHRGAASGLRAMRRQWTSAPTTRRAAPRRSAVR
jgi:hypothetical protein